MRYFIRLSYNGFKLSGWQIQKNADSVQDVLQKAFALLLKEKVEITGAGRTDSGVNAVNYIAHTDISSDFPLTNQGDFLYKINAILPQEIVVHSIFVMPDDAHARFDAESRTYKYFIGMEKDPFNSRLIYWCRSGKPDFEAMNKAAEYFIGTKDFTSLEKLHSGNQNSVCTVTEAHWDKAASAPPFDRLGSDSNYVFTVSANRFLRNMVRAMVGSLLEVGSGKKSPEWIAQMLEKKDRCSAGCSVPGYALFLTDIKYPYEIK